MRAICSASNRPKMSEPPPGVDETMILIVRDACDQAPSADKTSKPIAKASELLSVLIRYSPDKLCNLSARRTEGALAGQLAVPPRA
jgi:hypothetical protein